MSRSTRNFNDKKIKKSDFYKKNKKIYLIETTLILIKILIFSKRHMANIIHLNNLLGIMIMLSLDHYIYFFRKRQATLINLIKIK